MKLSWGDVLNATLVVCAATVTALVVRRELAPKPTSGGARHVEGWDTISVVGHRNTPAQRPVVIVEFSDFQCPYCKGVEPGLKSLLAHYPEKVALVYRHFPLSQIHPSARKAAVAAECAGNQGRFWEMHDQLFQNQDSLNVISMTGLARLAGVPDTAAFRGCLTAPAAAQAVSRDETLAQGLDLPGTPSFIVNGELLPGIPRASDLDQALKQSR